MRHQVRRRRWSWDGELYNLIQLKQMRGGDACAGGADVQRFGEFNKASTERVITPKKNRDLNADTGRLPLLGGGYQVFRLKSLTRHWSPLVRLT